MNHNSCVRGLWTRSPIGTSFLLTWMFFRLSHCHFPSPYHLSTARLPFLLFLVGSGTPSPCYLRRESLFLTKQWGWFFSCMFSVLTGFETNNKYEIKNSLGQRVYFAVEDTDCCTRNCCGASRPFTLRILDNMGREVMTLERPLRCSSCCFPCCLQEVSVKFP